MKWRTILNTVLYWLPFFGLIYLFFFPYEKWIEHVSDVEPIDWAAYQTLSLFFGIGLMAFILSS